MYTVRPFIVTKKLFSRNLTWEICTDKKNIFLTFDDGPTPYVTEEVLHILGQYHAKATFFCVGEMVKQQLNIYNQIIASGHAVGNHTFNHLNGWKTNTKDYIRNVELCDIYLNTNLFRPPYGKIKVSQLMQLKKDYQIIMWTVLSGDFDKRISMDQCLENVISSTKAGSIVVFHDSIKARENMLFTLPRFLAHFKKEGFEFAAI